jgi:hypothetical protein
MEYIYAFGKELLLVPIWALIQSPFVRISAKVAAASVISIRGAFMLGLIAGAAGLIASFMTLPFYWLVGNSVADSLAFIVGFFAMVWLHGYLLRSEGGNSIGLWRGFKVITLEILLILGVMVAVSLLAFIVISLWGLITNA